VIFASFLEELEARTAIEDSLKRFARAVDRQDWQAARALYHDGAFDDHGFFKGAPDALLAHIAKLHEHQDHSMHFNTNVLIEFQARERALVETYVLVLQRYRPGAPNVPAGCATSPRRATSIDSRSETANGASCSARSCSAMSWPNRCASRTDFRPGSSSGNTAWRIRFTR
jgi:SnoaL-like protein